MEIEEMALGKRKVEEITELLKKNPMNPEEIVDCLVENSACLFESDEIKTRTKCNDIISKLMSLLKNEKELQLSIWKKLFPHLLAIALKDFQLDLESRGIESERIGLLETKQLSTLTLEEEEDSRLPIEVELSKTLKYSVIVHSPSFLARSAIEPSPRAADRGSENSEQESEQQRQEKKNLIIESYSASRARSISSNASARIRLDSGAVVLMVHETMGWKSLETCLNGILCLIANFPCFVQCGCVSPELLHLIDTMCKHENRFVREIGYDYITEICEKQQQQSSSNTNATTFSSLENTKFKQLIILGLCDQWSQVILKACKSLRSFMRSLSEVEKTDEALLQTMIPRMCLNRYFEAADGIKFYSQETWRMIFQDQGREYVCKYVKSCVEYYILVSKTKRNDAIREAACLCFGELISKIDANAVRPFLLQILSVGLSPRFRDASWNVRFAACNASVQCFQTFGGEIPQNVLLEFYDVGRDLVRDVVFSVRDSGAELMGTLLRCSPSVIFPLLKHDLASWILVAHQQAQKQDEANLNHQHTPDCVHAATFNNHHTSATTKSKAIFACCSTDMMDEVSDPNSILQENSWEASDGAVRVLREIGKVDGSALRSFMDAYVECAHHAYRFPSLNETIWKSLPSLAESVGKKDFKLYFLDGLIPPLVSTLIDRSTRPLPAHSASLACEFLKTFLGPSIFQARIESALGDEAFREVQANPPTSFMTMVNRLKFVA